jgi:phospholipase/carboxylesterase
MTDPRDPHAGQPVEHTGLPLGLGRAVLILVHGRNAAPRNILELAGPLAHPDVTYLAPAAAGGSWYPQSFLADRQQNEPFLSSALGRLATLIDEVVAAGVPRSRIVLGGFSQGACLTSEFLYRTPDRYGGLLAFSGGLIGPPGTTWSPDGTLAGTPVFLGCSDVDAHIPKHRVEESADVFTGMNAAVTMRLYEGMGHVVNDDELAQARVVLAAAAGVHP